MTNRRRLPLGIRRRDMSTFLGWWITTCLCAFIASFFVQWFTWLILELLHSPKP